MTAIHSTEEVRSLHRFSGKEKKIYAEHPYCEDSPPGDLCTMTTLSPLCPDEDAVTFALYS